MTTKTPINDGVYAQVAGTVGRVNDGRFTIEVRNERAKFPDYVTVWRPEFTVTQGDRIAVKGWLSWKKTERNGKVYVDVSVNQPQVVAHEPAQQGGGWDDPSAPF
jgi:uncharacterized protein (DUF736 family)